MYDRKGLKSIEESLGLYKEKVIKLEQKLKDIYNEKYTT